jgi:hypothetical protein
MSFIRIYPFDEVTDFDPANLGQGDPARCQAVDEWDAREFFLNVHEIAGFEECPLYLVSPEDPNALVNGIRVVVRSGRSFLVADDPEDPEDSFLSLVQRSAQGEVTYMPFPRYLKSLKSRKGETHNVEVLPPE